MATEASSEWIEHDGGGCPVADDEIVEIRCRDGHQSVGPARHARSLWKHVPDIFPEWDILAYRVVSA